MRACWYVIPLVPPSQHGSRDREAAVTWRQPAVALVRGSNVADLSRAGGVAYTPTGHDSRRAIPVILLRTLHASSAYPFSH